MTYLKTVQVFEKVLNRKLKIKKTPVFILKLVSNVIGVRNPAGKHLLKAIAALATIDTSINMNHFNEVFPDFHIQTPEEFLLERLKLLNA